MKSRTPKVLHPVLGDPALLWVLRSLPPTLAQALVVVHHGKEQVIQAIGSWRSQGLLPCPVATVDQGEPLGTGHAVKACAGALDAAQAQEVLILSGDVPLLSAARVSALMAASPALLCMDLEVPGDYGRVLQHPDGSLRGIVEARDADAATLAVHRVNGGAYALPWPPLRDALARLSAGNAQGEYYLTDAVCDAASQLRVDVVACPADELAGMNSRADQAQLGRMAQAKINARWMEEGVSLLDPAQSWIGPRARLAADVFLEPGVRLEGTCSIGAGTRLGQGSILRDTVLDEEVEVRPYSLIEGTRAGKRCIIGPFARLREGSVLEDGVHVGNFVETKKALLHTGAKANHLTYLGDCEIGERTNVGAGVITCNYDGLRKHRTIIGKDAFIGSDTQLVAPVTIGDGAILGAGSTITQDVPADALAFTRPALTQKEGGASRLRAKQKAG
jgi:bifunctional UDP-N-acetylglucosamine pyrophosphorylase/glucosamine-1-phosphate N-acetyltransferase